MLIFLAPEAFPVPANLIESDEVREKQTNCRARITQKHAVRFFEKDQQEMLGRLVIQAIHNLRREALKEGTITKGDELVQRHVAIVNAIQRITGRTKLETEKLQRIATDYFLRGESTDHQPILS